MEEPSVFSIANLSTKKEQYVAAEANFLCDSYYFEDLLQF